MEWSADDTSVRVALRVRPQLAREKIDMCRTVTSIPPGEPQVTMGGDKAFTYDYAFDLDSSQDQIYDQCVRALIDGCFEGYNATIFAYGQTGSGKTYTMGTGFDVNMTPDDIGIIPRSVEHLFQGIELCKKTAQERGEPLPDFKVNAQFMELYNEDIFDLLDTTRDPDTKRTKSHIKIHEDAGGGIYTVGVTTRSVNSLEDTMQCLKIGSLLRSTASTNMNAQSSRSHAIFTLHIKQIRVVKNSEETGDEAKDTDTTEVESEFETLTAKFHFVDLAGSERLKRTGATGDRAKEGISINCGLLALGNVISALGDKTKKGSHVPYRDSKLTRLLQDSLGGNSRTTMIACVSPSDRDFMETLNTLKYANRARNIKNRVVANQDKTSRQLNALRSEIQALRAELLEYKQGKRVVDAEGGESYSDMFQESSMLMTENGSLRQRIKALQETIDHLRARNVQLVSEQAAAIINNIPEGSETEVNALVQRYIKEMEELRSKLMEAEAMCNSMRRSAARTPTRPTSLGITSPLHPNVPALSPFEQSTTPREGMESVIEYAKKDLKKLRKKVRTRQDSASEKENKSDTEDQTEDGKNEESQEKSEDEASDNEDDDDDDDLDEELELSSSDSDSDDKDSDNMHEDLADLTCDISIKEKLIEELENSQKRLHSLKVQYEDKLDQLASRIRDTEKERDKVLSNLGNLEHLTEEKTKKIKLEYERKIKEMGSEVKKLQAAQKEHSKLLRNHTHQDKQLKTLQHELSEMKKTKVKLMKDIKQEADRNRTAENKRNKELQQLRKQQREKDNLIKTLETQKNQKEVVLRRKQEEVDALRKRNKPMSGKAAGRVGKYNVPRTTPATTGIPSQPTSRWRKKKEFSSKAAKQKWETIEKCVSTSVTKRKTLVHMEKDMDHWLKQRERSSKKLEKLVAKRDTVIADDRFEQVKELNEEIGVLIGDINYIQDNITDCQNGIMQMEEEMKEEVDIASVVKTCSINEAQYLLEHLTQAVITKGLQSAQKESEYKELELKLEQHERDSAMHRTLLQQVVADHLNIEVEGLWGTAENGEESSNSSRSASPLDGLLGAPDTVSATSGSGGSNQSVNEQPGPRRDKARRKTATTADLLGTTPSGAVEPKLSPVSSAPLLPVPEEKPVVNNLPIIEEMVVQVTDADQKSSTLNNNETKELIIPTEPSPPSSPKFQKKSSKTLGSFDSGTYDNLSVIDNGGKTTNNNKNESQDANLMPPPKVPVTRSSSMSSKIKVEPSPVLRRKNMSNTNTDGVPPAASPALGRRNRESRDENVFNRLIGTGQANSNSRGKIVPFAGRLQASKSCPLVCSHRATGHSKAVLSVYATDDLLFSSSKDTTAKVWDLQSSQEIAVLGDHPNNVNCVKYAEETKMAFTVSSSFIKIWDLRRNTNTCVRTLNSSGMTINGSIPLDSAPGRQLNSGDPVIYDIALSHDGHSLYSVCGNIIRTWDLRKYLAVGKLSGGHTSAVMVLAVDRQDDKNILVSGGKDHYVKVFELDDNMSGVTTAKVTLAPPHYDGIQSLALAGNTLFSGSRDYCIKKWDLSDYSLKQSMNSAHKDWICALSLLPNGYLLSGCRGGVLKVWDVETCSPKGEVKAHKSAINAMATNSSCIFTASNNAEIGIWRLPGMDGSDSATTAKVTTV